MSLIEVMVVICIAAILALAAIPLYITYAQQAKVVSLVIPRLHLVESNISLFYAMNSKLPGSSELREILMDVDTENLDIALTNGVIILSIKARERESDLHILDGKILLASPVLTKNRIVAWRLDGELASRLKINH